METPIVKAGGQEEDATPSSNYGSIAKSEAISTESDQDISTGNSTDVSTGNEQVPGTGDDPAHSNENSQASISENSPAANPAQGPVIPMPDNSDDAGPYRHNSTKKNITQGLLNFALLTSNASQLKTVLDGGNAHPYFNLLVVSIILSILLQIVAGALMAYVAKLDIKDKEKEREKCSAMNVAVGILVFLVAAINVLLPVFGQPPAGNSP